VGPLHPTQGRGKVLCALSSYPQSCGRFRVGYRHGRIPLQGNSMGRPFSTRGCRFLYWCNAACCTTSSRPFTHFLTANGRLGRLFIILYLVERGPLSAPLLYLSSFFEDHKAQYYDSLQLVREEGEHARLASLLPAAVAVQATDAVERAERLVDLREKYRAQLSRTRSNAHQVIDLMLKNPILTARYLAQELRLTTQTGLNLLRQLESVGMLRQISDAPGLPLRWESDEVQRIVFARSGHSAEPQ
jgi:hypothetical protein